MCFTMLTVCSGIAQLVELLIVGSSPKLGKRLLQCRGLGYNFMLLCFYDNCNAQSHLKPPLCQSHPASCLGSKRQLHHYSNLLCHWFHSSCEPSRLSSELQCCCLGCRISLNTSQLIPRANLSAPAL